MTGIIKRVESVNVVHARTQTRARFYKSVQRDFRAELAEPAVVLP